ncbi:MAG TPA: glycosyltransferase family 2 protein [Candidatus Saccharimonadia bacterium]|nr:glycosyltransferase family 2 protein [Candidatus Saccharimonadia bacterium]
MAEPLSVVVTTLDNAATLAQCLGSVAGLASEIVVLDSGSRDDTEAIARAHGARFVVEPFKGYGAQKASAIAHAAHDWVLLLDADEALDEASRAAIRAVLEAPAFRAYTLPRREQLFWTWQHVHAKHNAMLRLFDRRCVRFGTSAIHAAPETDVPVGRIDAPFLHHGEPDIATKVAKINHYSSGLVEEKLAQGYRWLRLRMVLQPPWQFAKNYVFKRRFLSGTAGFIASVTEAYYVFLKYAKVHEAQRRHGDASRKAAARPRDDA